MSDLLIKLWQNGILQLGIWETIYMTLISTFFAYLIGLPVGLILRMTDRDGIHPIGWLNRTASSSTPCAASRSSSSWSPCCRWQRPSSAPASATAP